MAHAIVFVPGKNPKPPPTVHREYLWRSLCRGVARHEPAIATRFGAECRFTLAAWNFLYYQEHRRGYADVPWIDRLIASDGASAADQREARRWSRGLTRLLYTLMDHLPRLIAWLPDHDIKAMIQDTLRYFENTGGIADRVRALVRAEILAASERGGSVCVIGHSMGSVIAYEALWELAHEHGPAPRIGLFLTLGSPLGMNYVQRRLLGLRDASHRYPGPIGSWVNVAAVGDLVSVDEQVADDFAPMLAQGLVGEIKDLHGDIYTAFRNDEGLNTHRSYGYLVHPRVGAAIAAWWRER